MDIYFDSKKMIKEIFVSKKLPENFFYIVEESSENMRKQIWVCLNVRWVGRKKCLTNSRKTNIHFFFGKNFATCLLTFLVKYWNFISVLHLTLLTFPKTSDIALKEGQFEWLLSITYTNLFKIFVIAIC